VTEDGYLWLCSNIKLPRLVLQVYRQSHSWNFLYFTYIPLLMNSLSCLSTRRSSLGQLYTAKSISLCFRKVKSLEESLSWNRCTVLVIWAVSITVHRLCIARQPENIQKTTESDAKSQKLSRITFMTNLAAHPLLSSS